MDEPYGMQDYSDGIPTYSLDLVCGRPVNEEKPGGKAMYLGVTYYFCCKDCKHAFEEHPGQYTGVMRAAGAA